VHDDTKARKIGTYLDLVRDNRAGTQMRANLLGTHGIEVTKGKCTDVALICQVFEAL
jgi:hypothetical protein